MSKAPEIGADTAPTGRGKPDIRRLLFVLVLIGFAVSIGVGIDNLSTGNALVKQLLAENVLWAATQVHVELLRLQSALLRLADQADAAAIQNMQFRLDILWSRLTVLSQGEVGQFLTDTALYGQADVLRGALDRLDALVPVLSDPTAPGFETAVAEAQVLVGEKVETTHAWTLEVLHGDRRRSLAVIDGREDTLVWLVAAFAGLVLAGAVFAGLLLREIQRANTSSAQATSALASAAAAERRLIDAIETIPEGFALYDADDRLVVFNDRYREIYAASSPVIYAGNSFEAIVRYGAERDQYTEAIGRVDDWVRERVERHRNPGDPIEQRLANNRWLRIEERPTGEGGIVGVRVDITDIKRAQQLLERAEQAADLGHFNLDPATQRMRWSPQMYRILGVDRDDPLDTPETLLDRFDAPEAERLRAMLSAIAQGGPVVDAILETRQIRGERCWVEVTLQAEPAGEDEHLGVFGTVQDVTARQESERRLAKAMADAEAANAAKSRFLSIMSHEIRTPMNGIAGALNLIDTDRLDPDTGEMIQVARSSTDRLRTVLNDVLDYTRIESGRMTLEPEAFDPRAFAAEAASFWAGSAAAKRLTLRRHVAAEVAPALVGDVGRLRQIVDNLMSNAIKYTPAGSVVLSLSLDLGGKDTGPADDRQRLVIAVKDTGLGIAPEDRGRVFVDFSQLHHGKGLAQGGSGLGLAICRRLVEQMDGHIDFDSQPGEGTIFRAEIPLPVAPSGAIDRHTAAPSGSAPVLPEGLRVLLAEDIPTNQLIAKKTLEQLGCTVDIAADGREAVAAVEARPYDVVLMDVSMPDMDGLAATRAIRAALQPGPPILAFTAYAMTEDQERFREAGMDGVVAKPIATAELVRGIAAVVHGRPSAEPALAGPEATPSGGALVDLTVLRTLDDSLDASTFAELCQRFQRDVDRCVAEIRSANGGGDPRGAVERASHTLTSIAATMGADALSRSARQINTACREAGDLPSQEAVAALDRLAVQTLACVRDCTTCGHAAHCVSDPVSAEA